MVGFPAIYWAAVQFGMNAEALFREVSSAADARGAEAHDRFGFPNLSVNLRRTWAGGLSKPQTDHATSCSGERTSVIAQGLRIALAATHTSHEPRALDRLTIRWETRVHGLVDASAWQGDIWGRRALGIIGMACAVLSFYLAVIAARVLRKVHYAYLGRTVKQP